MTEPSVLPGDPHAGRSAGHRAARTKRRSGCLPMLLVLVVVAGLAVAGYVYLLKPTIDDFFGDPEDFAGPGEGEVCFMVLAGDSVSSVGDRLEDEGVVASSEAFSEAAEAEGAGVFPGSFALKRKMDAAGAVEILADIKNDGCVSELTFLPGKTVKDIVALLAENTEFSKAAYNKVLDNPESLGLPPEANGNAEGYLYPGSYEVDRKDTPRTILAAMVDRWHSETEELDFERRAARLGYDTHEMLTIASLVEAEGSTVSDADKARIARVIFNRLENPTAETAGFLGIDSTVAYALGFNPGVALTQEQLEVDSPYNTRENKGLPPGPIESPSLDSIEAALNPAEGDWLYWVTVNLKTGETKFADTHDEFLVYKAELTEYCEGSDAC